MTSAAAANAATFLLTAFLVVLVLIRRPSARSVGNLLLLLLASILIWSGGAVWRSLAPDHNQMVAAQNLVFLGVNLVGTVWLLLALTATRPAFIDAHPNRKAWIAAPGILLFLACLTNPGHEQFARIDFQVFERQPLFWVTIAWAFSCSLAGSFLFLERGRRIARSSEGKGALLFVAASLVPLVVSSSYLFKLFPWPMDPTPASLGFSAALLYPVILKLRTLEDLPLVRQDLIDQLRDAVLIADPGGRVIDHNSAAQKLLGRAGVRGTLLSDLIAELSPSQQVPDLRSVLEKDGFSLEILADAGQSLRVRGGAALGSGGQSVGFYVTLRDISRERQAERALRQAQKLEMVGTLAGGIAHEINNPLSFVRSNLSFVADEIARREQVASSNELPGVLAESIQGVDRISEIVGGLRRLAHAEQGERELIDLNDLLAEAWRLASLYDATPCELQQQLADDLPKVWGVRSALLQAFLNLLANATQAAASSDGCEASEAGTVRITTARRADRIRIEVEDDGPGIGPELRDRVLDPFFTTRAPDEGVGLGLPIAFEVIREHQGRLEVGDSSLGGARVSVDLPLKAE